MLPLSEGLLLGVVEVLVVRLMLEEVLSETEELGVWVVVGDTDTLEDVVGVKLAERLRLLDEVSLGDRL